MSARHAAVLGFGLLLAGCGGGNPPAATGAAPATRLPGPADIRFGPGGPWRYRYLRADTLLTTLPNGGLQQQVVERQLQLTWVVRPAAEGLELVVTIDSAKVIGLAAEMARPMADSARGAVIRAWLTPEGRLTLQPTLSGGAVAGAFASNLPWMQPRVPDGVQEGSTWSDSLRTTVRFGIVDLQELGARATTATVQGGVRRYVMTGTVARDGVSPQLRVDGTGARWGTAALGADGVIQELTGRDSIAMIASVEAIGQRVQIVQIGGYTLTPLP